MEKETKLELSIKQADYLISLSLLHGDIELAEKIQKYKNEYEKNGK
jgi:hypothetical protein